MSKQLAILDWDEEEKELLIRCSCTGHSLSLITFLDGEEEFIYASFLNHKHDSKPGLWFRMKTAWRVIFKGRHEIDEVLIHYEEAKVVADAINTLVDRLKAQRKFVQGYPGPEEPQNAVE